MLYYDCTLFSCYLIKMSRCFAGGLVLGLAFIFDQNQKRKQWWILGWGTLGIFTSIQFAADTSSRKVLSLKSKEENKEHILKFGLYFLGSVIGYSFITMTLPLVGYTMR